MFSFLNLYFNQPLEQFELFVLNGLINNSLLNIVVNKNLISDVLNN